MDALVKDNPEMAFELLKMMNEKQRRTTLELDETLRVCCFCVSRLAADTLCRPTRPSGQRSRAWKVHSVGRAGSSLRGRRATSLS